MTEMNMIQKLIARQSKLETDFARFTDDIVAAFENMQEDITVAAVSQAINTECDNVQAEYVTDTRRISSRLSRRGMPRDKGQPRETLEGGFRGRSGERRGGFTARRTKTEADVARLQHQGFGSATTSTSVNEAIRGAARGGARSPRCLHAVDVESIQAELDAGAADRRRLPDDAELGEGADQAAAREEDVASM